MCYKESINKTGGSNRPELQGDTLILWGVRQPTVGTPRPWAGLEGAPGGRVVRSVSRSHPDRLSGPLSHPERGAVFCDGLWHHPSQLLDRAGERGSVSPESRLPSPEAGSLGPGHLVSERLFLQVLNSKYKAELPHLQGRTHSLLIKE